MFGAFLFVVFAMLGALVASDWMRHRDDSIVAGLGNLVTESFGGVTERFAPLIGVVGGGAMMTAALLIVASFARPSVSLVTAVVALAR